MTQLEVDARGLRCPLPVIRLAEAAKDAAAGDLIIVLATDPGARHDIPAWCRMRNHELLEMTEVAADPVADAPLSALAAPARPPYLRFVVTLRAQPPKTSGAGTSRARWSRST